MNDMEAEGDTMMQCTCPGGPRKIIATQYQWEKATGDAYKKRWKKAAEQVSLGEAYKHTCGVCGKLVRWTREG